MNLFENLHLMQESEIEYTSPLVITHHMSEKELRDYVNKNGLKREYNMMLNNKPNYSYSNQMKVLRDLVADHIASTNAKN